MEAKLEEIASGPGTYMSIEYWSKSLQSCFSYSLRKLKNIGSGPGTNQNVFSSDTSDMDVRKVLKIHLILEKTILELYC